MAKTILQGDIGAISLADLFSLFNLSKKTGCLICRFGEVTKKVFWEEGEVVFAASSLREDNLGNFLVDRGIITQEQNVETSGKISAGVRHGKILVQHGYLRPEQLLWGVRNQVLEILYSLFLWDSGSFEFQEGALENQEKVTLSASTTRVVMEGIRRLDEWNRIREAIPDPTAIPRRTGKISRGEGPPPSQEKRILDLVDGCRSFDSIAGEAHIGSYEGYVILCRLLTAGFIRISARRGRGNKEDGIVFKVVGKR